MDSVISVSYHTTNRVFLSSPFRSLSPLLDTTFRFKFRHQGSSPTPYKYARAAADHLSFAKIRSSINEALARVGLHDRFLNELVMFAWRELQTHFGGQPITNTNYVVIDIEVMLEKRRRVGGGIDIGSFIGVGSCSICLEDFFRCPKFVLPCSHSFHRGCIDEWLKRKPNCPLCRRNVPPERAERNN